MRKENWPIELDKKLSEARDTPFKWGKLDCCLFAAGCVQAMTGLDLAAEYRGKYRSEIGARKLMLETAGGDVEAVMERAALQASLEEIPVLFAQQGDVALVEDNGRDVLGIVTLMGIACKGEKGLVFHKQRAGKRAWRV